MRYRRGMRSKSEEGEVERSPSVVASSSSARPLPQARMAPRPRLPALLSPARQLHSTACARLPPPPLPTTVAASLAAASSSPGPAPDTLSGWVRSVRRQKNVSFAVLSDGTQVGGVQVVLPKGLDDGCVPSLPPLPPSHLASVPSLMLSCVLQPHRRMLGKLARRMGRQPRPGPGQGVQGRRGHVRRRERRRGASRSLSTSLPLST